MYQEQLEQRKQPDIFAQPSSSDFLILLQPESEDPMSSGQAKVEKLCLVWRKERSIPNLSGTRCLLRTGYGRLTYFYLYCKVEREKERERESE